MRLFGPDVITDQLEPKTRFQQFSEGTWIKWIPYRAFGFPIGARMTVIRLPNGELWAHTPFRLDAPLLKELNVFGNLKYLIAPNRLHDLDLEDFNAIPNLEAYASPRLFQIQANLPWRGCLTGEGQSNWHDAIDQILIAGSSWMDEVVFFHRSSETLILADLLEYFDDKAGKLWRPLTSLGGVYRRYGMTRDQRYLIHDRAAFRASIRQILEWPISRIILSHGPLIRENGKEIFRSAFDWLFH